MADSAVGMSKNSMNPKPRGLPVSRSFTSLQAGCGSKGGRAVVGEGTEMVEESRAQGAGMQEGGGRRTKACREVCRAQRACCACGNAPDVLDGAHLAEMVDHVPDL